MEVPLESCFCCWVVGADNDARGQAIGLDRSFGDSGVVTTDFGGGTDIGIDLLLLPDGKLVLAGWSGVVGNSDLAFARYHPDGSLDTAFGMAGRVIIDIRPEDRIFESALQADGKIVAAGLTAAALNSPRDFLVVRLNADGTLDNSFGANGVVTTDVDPTDLGQGVALQPDGKIIVTGFTGFLPSQCSDTTQTDLCMPPLTAMALS